MGHPLRCGMADRPSSTSGVRRRRVLVGAALGWILVIVAGAGADADDSLLGVDNLDVVWFVILGLAVVFSIAFLIYLNPFAGEWVEPEKKRRSFGFIIFIAAVAALWLWRPAFLSDLAEEDALGGLEEVFDSEVDTTPQEPAPETVAQATDLLLIALVVAALGGLWYFLRRRSQQLANLDSPSSDLALEADLVQALEDASIELAITGDPRTAVLRSYAVLEAVLASHGLSRTRAETPTEHLRRSLRNLRIDNAPLLELGRLYELARFSDRPITTQQQADAARALDRARTSLTSQS